MEKTYTQKEVDKLIADIRQAFGDYVWSEGCGCCEYETEHKKAAEKLGRLLKVGKCADNSGYDFMKYQTQK